MTPGQYSVQETKQVLDLGFALTGAIVASKESNGGFGMEDMAKLMLVWPSVAPAVDKIADVPKELGELDSEDVKELLDHAKSRLGMHLSDEVLLKRVSAVLKLVLSGAEAVAEWQDAAPAEAVNAVPVPAPAQ